MRNLRVELHEHRFIDMEGNFRARALNQKEKNLSGSVTTVLKTDTLQSGVAKKMRDEEIQKVR